MHNSPIGTRINCDMTKVTRALSQFLVTEDLQIVANDLDDLPEVTKDSFPNCTWGKIEDRDPNFQSPEEKSYLPNQSLQPFTEKADIWKLVNMLKFIMYKVRIRFLIEPNLFYSMRMERRSVPLMKS